mmetsp:Transcript_10680/g.25307  ORF Transcript_10680/g.25307 Transcript_10680/m.25307 type:complete len:409 (+) Transcript_10680:126-1352(+)
MNILLTSCTVCGILFLTVAVDAFTVLDKDYGVAHFRATTTTTLHANLPNRRNFGGLLGSGILSLGTANIKDADAAVVTQTKALVDVPMVRLRLPKGGFGREYIALKLNVKGQGPFDFMIDSGLTTELITPHLQGILGINEGRSRLSGLAAGGRTTSNAVVELTGASIDAGDGSSTLDLPKLTAVITDFPQEHIDPSHDPVEGMLGMELLSLFDVDLDFPNNRIRLFEPSTADTSGLVEIPAVVINESMLIGIRVSSTKENSQPILGFLDCGSTFSCINWKAAQALGLPPKSDPMYRSGPAVAALGIDGRPLTLPTVKKQLSYAGNPILDPKSGRPVAFESPPADWKAWDIVQLAVGDIPAFSNILGDGVTPYEGPAALIGLDILAQRRVVLEAGTTNSRRRKVAIAPK